MHTHTCGNTIDTTDNVKLVVREVVVDEAGTVVSDLEGAAYFLQVVNARGIVTLQGSTSGSCDGSGNGSCAQNPWEPAGTRSNRLRELKSIFSAFFRILFAFLEMF